MELEHLRHEQSPRLSNHGFLVVQVAIYDGGDLDVGRVWMMKVSWQPHCPDYMPIENLELPIPGFHEMQGFQSHLHLLWSAWGHGASGMLLGLEEAKIPSHHSHLTGLIQSTSHLMNR